MEVFWNFLSKVMECIVAIVLIISVASVMIVAMTIMACLFPIAVLFGLIWWMMGGKLPDFSMKKELDKSE